MKIIAANKKANYNFTISNKIEAGIVLTGSEVKSLRINTGSIRGSYIIEENGELWLSNSFIKKYQNSKNFIMNNMMIMSNTFDLLTKYKKPFLFASSQMSNMLYSNYGLLKLIGERITSTLNGNFVKLWNVYGIENDTNKSHVITDFVLKAIKFKKIKMLTNGKESREFLYADDCCEALEIIMKKHNFFKNQKQELHLTNGIKTKIVDIAKIIKKNLSNKNLKIKIISGKSKDNIQLNKNNKNNNFLKKYWKPKVSISTGINKIINHYLED